MLNCTIHYYYTFTKQKHIRNNHGYITCEHLTIVNYYVSLRKHSNTVTSVVGNDHRLWRRVDEYGYFFVSFIGMQLFHQLKYTHTDTYARTYRSTCTHTHTHARTHAHTHTHTNESTHKHMYNIVSASLN